ncbi:MAG TPA: aldo/keto reductase, partial [Spirochaetia bacterium]|nr:aldo/keto reductase [Spirochaetia bacterium]
MNNQRSETKPRIILGTMTFGGQTEERDAGEMVRVFLESGNRDLDTAYIYMDGKTEEILGHIIKRMKRDTFGIATKVHPRVDGSLRPESINKQLETSLSRLGLESVDLLYLHSPDPETPVEIT